MSAIRNKALPALMLIAAVAGACGGFVAEAPNRLISGTPVAMWHALDPLFLGGIAVLAAVLVALSFVPPSRALQWSALTLAAFLFVVLMIGAGSSAASLSQGAAPAARVSLGWGFWLMSLAAIFAVIDAAQRLKLTPLARFAVAVIVAGAVVAILLAGWLDQLSILREFAVRRAVFASEFLRHIELVLGALAPALVIGVALGLAAARRPKMRNALFGTLNLLQTIPSVALFGLLIAPLSALATAFPFIGALGIRGVGVAPAIIALVLYALLPVARNSLAGIEAADPAIIEAARGMGFTARQVFWRAQLPLGLPVFLAGLRIVLVQTIGLAVIAALIGGGGLGSFIFQGIGQYAIDLVLLGAIPVTLLALAADFLLRLAIASFEEGRQA